VVEFQGSQVFSAAEKFYTQSEQRLTRFFRHDEEDIVMIAAQPDCDLEWLEGLDTEAAKRLGKDVELSLLEQRHYRFECGCTHQRMVEMLAPVMRSQADDLFASEETVRVQCPRCGRTHAITREAMEAYLQAHKE
jgi:molecular chaperone Hsp33